VAQGLLTVIETSPPRVPLVVRLIGTNEERAREMLSGARLETASGMDEVVQKAIAAARSLGEAS
jgi:succinyl-CoA synthetase beta subunit